MTTRLAREQYQTHEFIAARHADWFDGRGAGARERFLLVGYRSSIRAALRDGDVIAVNGLLNRVSALGLDDREFLHLYPKWSRHRIHASLARRLAPVSRLLGRAAAASIL